MIYYKIVKVIINAKGFIEVIINVVVKHHGFLNSIINNRKSLFISKFWLLLYYFLSFKQKLFNTFYLQIDSQIKRQNSIIKVYL